MPAAPAVSTMLSFKDRVAIVTGASGGIGRGIAERLAEAGAAVALQFLNNEAGAQTSAEKIRSQGGQAVAIGADLADTRAILHVFKQTQSSLGAPSVLVNCAALQPVVAFRDISMTDWSDLMRINLDAVMATTQAFAAHCQSASGAIVNISSIEGSSPAPGHAHYAASKAGLEMLTKASALELAAQGIRVNAVAPGLIDRPGLSNDWPEGVRRWEAAAPLKRLGMPEDVADAALFLASSAARWITGIVLTVDGGVSTRPTW